MAKNIEKMNQIIPIRFSARHLSAIDRAAADRGLSRSSWIRITAVDAVRRIERQQRDA